MDILYGINGEGMGHAMRSAEIIKHLIEKNNVFVVVGGRASVYIKKIKNLKKLIKTSHLSFVMRDGDIKYIRTIIFNIIKLPVLIYNFLYVLIKSIIKRPKLIISDFEPITSYVGLFLRIPVISFDNQHVVTDTKISEINGFFPKFLYSIVVHIMVPFPKKKIITGFFYPKILRKNSVLVNPIVRKKIVEQKSKKGDKFIVYLTMKNDLLLNELEKLKNKCIVYGKTDRKSSKYLEIKNFNENQFAHDLANARAVICNAGMTTLSESIYLKKPILCIPLRGQVEQEINAYYIEKSGYGLSSKFIDKHILNKFTNNLKMYEKKLTKTNISNERVLRVVDDSIKEIIS